MHLILDNLERPENENNAAKMLDEFNIEISDDIQYIYFPNMFLSEVIRFKRIK